MNYFIAPGLKKQQLDSYRRNQLREIDEKVKQIMYVVEEETGITIKRLESPDRTRAVTEARQMAMYLIRKYTKYTMVTVGRLFGRDHSTVIYSLANVNNMIDSKNFDFVTMLKKIEEKVK